MELKFLDNVHPPPCVTYHVSGIRCQVSGVGLLSMGPTLSSSWRDKQIFNWPCVTGRFNKQSCDKLINILSSYISPGYLKRFHAAIAKDEKLILWQNVPPQVKTIIKKTILKLHDWIIRYGMVWWRFDKLLNFSKNWIYHGRVCFQRGYPV